MANRKVELEVALTAQDDASKIIDKVAGKAEKFDGKKYEADLGVDTGAAERDIDGLLSKVDKLGSTDAANLLLTTNASQITNEIADLVIKLDTLDANDPAVDITVANIATLQGDLDQISTKAKEINDTPIKMDTTGAVSGIDQIGKSADSSKSVMANMVGNATQDLGSLGGIAGSAGVAIGQMGEYMVDAANSGDKMGAVLKNFAAVAGPIALIAATIEVLTGVMGEIKAEAEATAARTDAFGEAMRGAVDDTLGLADALRDDAAAMEDFNAHASDFGGLFLENLGMVARQLPLIGGLFDQEGTNIAAIAEDVGLSIYAIAAAAEGVGAPAWDAYRLAVDEAVASGAISEAQAETLSAFINQQARSVDAATDAQKLFNVSAEEANAILKETKFETEPLEQYTDKWGVLSQDMKDGSIDSQAAADAINFLADALGLTQAEVIALAQQNIDETFDEAREAAFEFAQAVADAQDAMEGMEPDEGFDRVIEQLNAASELDFSAMALDTVQSFDDIKGALEAAEEAGVDWGDVDFSPESLGDLHGIPDELAAVTESVIGMRGSIQTELAAAFDTGGVEAFTDKAGFFAQQITDQFLPIFTEMTGDAGLAQGKVNELLEELGLLPEQVTTQINLTRQEQALAALETFRGVIETLPSDVQVAINTAIAEGDIEGALAMLNTELINAGYDPIVLPVDADIAEANDKVEQVVRFADGSTGVVQLDANPDPATGKTNGVVEFMDGSTGTVTIEGDPDPATGKVGGVIRYADGSTGTVLVDADPDQANDAIEDVESGQYDATVDTDSDTTEAKSGIKAVEDADHNTTIDTDADTVAAAAHLLDVTTRQRNARIYAVADADAADARLDSVASASRTAQINANANTAAAESELNNAARNRTSTIFVRTVEQRQAGGPVEANKPYIVGEAGPELVVPRSSGTVIPNHKIATTVPRAGGNGHGGGSTVINVNVVAPLGDNPAAMGQRIRQALIASLGVSGPADLRKALGMSPVAGRT